MQDRTEAMVKYTILDWNLRNCERIWNGDYRPRYSKRKKEWVAKKVPIF